MLKMRTPGEKLALLPAPHQECCGLSLSAAWRRTRQKNPGRSPREARRVTAGVPSGRSEGFWQCKNRSNQPAPQLTLGRLDHHLLRPKSP